MGSVTDYLPLQVAYRLNLTGPALAVQTTCSTSLVAVYLASHSLLLGECDAALAGGVSLIVPQGHGYLHVPDDILSVDGRTRAFGAQASGIVYTQGVGVVVLRRLAAALVDGDPVRAVIRGTAVNNDGARQGRLHRASLQGRHGPSPKRTPWPGCGRHRLAWSRPMARRPRWVTRSRSPH